MADKTSVMRGGKVLQVKVRNVTRSMTAATQLATLPKGSRFLGIELGGTASDAGTTATLSFGTTTTATELVNAQSVLAAGAGSGFNALKGVTGVGVSVAPPFTSDTPIFAKYAETGTASTAGAWIAIIYYTTGNITDDDTI
jgi:hypothetical protein